ncbi:MAG: hypothetical protein ACRD5K_13110 [Candidatus Acidiferrales bacterium]
MQTGALLIDTRGRGEKLQLLATSGTNAKKAMHRDVPPLVIA